jgi:hypothetical protein
MRAGSAQFNLRLLRWVLLMIGLTVAPIWIVLSRWNPANDFQLAAVMVFAMGRPIGALNPVRVTRDRAIGLLLVLL